MKTFTGLLKIGLVAATHRSDPRTRLKTIIKSIEKQQPGHPDLKGLHLLSLFRSKEGSFSDARLGESLAHAYFRMYNVKLPKFEGYTEFFRVKPEEVSTFLQSKGFEVVKSFKYETKKP